MKTSNRSTVLAFFVSFAFLSYFAVSAVAQDVLDPNIMTVKDAGGETVESFSTAELKANFSQRIYDTRTPWTAEDETIIYRGPLLGDVLSEVGQAYSATVRVTAYNDFISDIKMDEIRSYEPIIAVERNCTDQDRQNAVCGPEQGFRPIAMAENGPMFVVWPYDRLPETYHPWRNGIWVFFPISVQPLP